MYSFDEIRYAWEQVKNSFRGRVSESSIDLWFGDIKLVGCRNNVLHMETDRKYKYDVVMRDYFEEIRQGFKKYLCPDFEVEFVCTGETVTVAQIIENMRLSDIGESYPDPEDEKKDKNAKKKPKNPLLPDEPDLINFSDLADMTDFSEFGITDEDEDEKDAKALNSGRDAGAGSKSRKKTEAPVSHGIFRGYVDPSFAPNATREDLRRSNFELGERLAVKYTDGRGEAKFADRTKNSADVGDGKNLNTGAGEYLGDILGGAGSGNSGGAGSGNSGGKDQKKAADGEKKNPDEYDPKPREMPEYNFQYTFENFIVGSSNKFAHAACVAVAEHPAKNYNPLFIYGQSGLGKTHLLNAITNYMTEHNPKIKIIYIKGADFTNYMVDCISRNAMKEFRNKYRMCDVLLIDDIQFIAGKESTQEEFFHTFNALYDEGKQIILTSDRPPRDIQHLENRLKSRFEWGLLADIQPPDLELRIAIIKAKSEAVNLRLSGEILQYLAENLRSNVRQIEGAIKKLGAISFLSGREVIMEDAARCVAELLGDDRPTTVTIDKIFTVVFQKYGVSKEDILSANRQKNIANARHVAIYLARETTDLSLPSIGTIFCRDHSTVKSSIDKVAKKTEVDPVFSLEVKDLKKQIND